MLEKRKARYVKIVSSIMARTSYGKGEGPEFNSRNRPRLFTSFEKKNSLSVAFNSSFRYIDDVLSINNNQFHPYVDLIYPNKLQVYEIDYCSLFMLFITHLVEENLLFTRYSPS
jgi:hypothetical protein